MQIAQLKTSSSGVTSGTTSGTGTVEATAATDKDTSASATTRSSSTNAAPPLRRGLSSFDHQLQGEISSAQQALDFLEQSTSQLQALKSELAAKLASQAQAGREGQVEARVRQFSNTWKERSNASGGTLDSQLDYTSPEPATQRFSIRGLNMANLQAGGKEVLAFSVGGSNQALRSVNIEPGLSQEEIVLRFDQALAPDKIRVGMKDDGTLVFSTPEGSWTAVRDTLAVRGNGLRFPTGQLSRVKTDEEPAAIAPDNWTTDDTSALRHTLQQVIAALALVQRAKETVTRALAQASNRVDSAQPGDVASGVGMDQLAQNFTETATEPGYKSLLSITSALAGISRERVLSLLSLR